MLMTWSAGAGAWNFQPLGTSAQACLSSKSSHRLLRSGLAVASGTAARRRATDHIITIGSDGDERVLGDLAAARVIYGAAGVDVLRDSYHLTRSTLSSTAKDWEHTVFCLPWV